MVELSGAVALFAAAFVVVILCRLSALEKRVATISHIDGKLDALLKNAGVEYNPYDNLPDQVVQALQRDEKIQAIKHYREATGAGLKDAKEFIEEIQERRSIGG